MKYVFHFVDGQRNIYNVDGNLADMLTFVADNVVGTGVRSLDNMPEIINFKYVIRIEEFLEVPDMD